MRRLCLLDICDELVLCALLGLRVGTSTLDFELELASKPKYRMRTNFRCCVLRTM
jgi:hypothetical protein